MDISRVTARNMNIELAVDPMRLDHIGDFRSLVATLQQKA